MSKISFLASKSSSTCVTGSLPDYLIANRHFLSVTDLKLCMPYSTIFCSISCLAVVCFVSFCTWSIRFYFLRFSIFITGICRFSPFLVLSITGIRMSMYANDVFCKQIDAFPSMHCQMFISEL